MCSDKFSQKLSGMKYLMLKWKVDEWTFEMMVRLNLSTFTYGIEVFPSETKNERLEHTQNRLHFANKLKIFAPISHTSARLHLTFLFI